MRIVFGKRRIYQVAAITTALLMVATPGAAEAPLDEPLEKPSREALSQPSLTQQSNIRRLLLTNECTGCDLTGATLSGEHLIGADLRRANLRRANFTNANLEGADLEGADLTDANFTGAYLTDAYLANTQLISVNFTEAHLYNTDVTGATIEDLNLAGADIYNTPISVGGEEAPFNEPLPLEPMIPFEEVHPPAPPSDYWSEPIL